MRYPIIIISILLIVNALVDLYIYCAVHSYTRKRFWHRLQAWSALIFALALIATIILPKRAGSDDMLQTVMWILYAYFSIYIPKYIFLIFDVLSRIPFLWRGTRWSFLSVLGALIGVGVCGTMWWGALINRYNVDVKRIEVEIQDLPQSFQGLRIAQISDLHLGSFASPEFPKKLVDSINALEPDLVVFTGDIVNRRSEELDPFMATLSQIKAPLGVYSVMGNHDYGEYMTWPSDAARKRDVVRLKRNQGKMGWKMLNNATHWLHVDSDSIALIGVENVGDPPFSTYGDLLKAYPDISDDNIKILLTHNPTHWVRDLRDNPASNIALTLSGHTHAMQIMVLGWSPAMWRYPTWGGMYADGHGQRLYVNIGAGEVAIPTRIGATPEITLFTLK